MITELLLAIYNNDPKEVSTLLQSPELPPINYQSFDFQQAEGVNTTGTLLMHAIYSGHAAMVNLLLEHKDKEGQPAINVNAEVKRRTALDRAIAANLPDIVALIQAKGGLTHEQVAQSTHNSLTSRTICATLKRLRARYDFANLDVNARCNDFYAYYNRQRFLLIKKYGMDFVTDLSLMLDFVNTQSEPMVYADRMTHQQALALLYVAAEDTLARVAGTETEAADNVKHNRWQAIWQALAWVSEMCSQGKFNGIVSALNQLHPDYHVITNADELSGSIRRSMQIAISIAFKQQTFATQLMILAVQQELVLEGVEMGEAFYQGIGERVLPILSLFPEDVLPAEKYSDYISMAKEIDIDFPQQTVLDYLSILLRRMKINGATQEMLFSPEPGCDDFVNHLAAIRLKISTIVQKFIVNNLNASNPFFVLWNDISLDVQKDIIDFLVKNECRFIELTAKGALLNQKLLLSQIIGRLPPDMLAELRTNNRLQVYLKAEVATGKDITDSLTMLPSTARELVFQELNGLHIIWNIDAIVTALDLIENDPWRSHLYAIGLHIIANSAPPSHPFSRLWNELSHDDQQAVLNALLGKLSSFTKKKIGKTKLVHEKMMPLLLSRLPDDKFALIVENVDFITYLRARITTGKDINDYLSVLTPNSRQFFLRIFNRDDLYWCASEVAKALKLITDEQLRINLYLCLPSLESEDDLLTMLCHMPSVHWEEILKSPFVTHPLPLSDLHKIYFLFFGDHADLENVIQTLEIDLINNSNFLLAAAIAGHYDLVEFLLIHEADFMALLWDEFPENEQPAILNELLVSLRAYTGDKSSLIHETVLPLLLSRLSADKFAMMLMNADLLTYLKTKITKGKALTNYLSVLTPNSREVFFRIFNIADLSWEVSAIAEVLKLITDENLRNSLYSLLPHMVDGLKVYRVLVKVPSIYWEEILKSPFIRHLLPLYNLVQVKLLDICDPEYQLNVALALGVDVVNERKLLFSAVELGACNLVEFLLVQGADLKTANSEGMTLLYVAAKNGQGAVVELLITHGADYTTPQCNGRTPLYVAAESGHDNVVELLIKHGADFTAPLTVAEHYTGYPVHSIFTPLYAAAANGHLNVVELLVSHGADFETQNVIKDGYQSKNDFFMTPLCAAASYGHAGVVEWLISHGADFTTSQKDGCNQGFTPIYFAAKGGKTNVVELLLAHGADFMSPLTVHNDHQISTTLLAPNKNYVEFEKRERIVFLLLQHWTINPEGTGLAQSALALAITLLKAALWQDEAMMTLLFAHWGRYYAARETLYQQGKDYTPEEIAIRVIIRSFPLPMARALIQEDSKAPPRDGYLLDKVMNDRYQWQQEWESSKEKAPINSRDTFRKILEQETLFYQILDYLKEKSTEAGGEIRYRERMGDFRTLLNYLDKNRESPTLYQDFIQFMDAHREKNPICGKRLFGFFNVSKEKYLHLCEKLKALPENELAAIYKNFRIYLAQACVIADCHPVTRELNAYYSVNEITTIQDFLPVGRELVPCLDGGF